MQSKPSIAVCVMLKMVAKRRRFSKSAAGSDGDLESMLSAFFKSADQLQSPPAHEARKAKQMRLCKDAGLYKQLIGLSPNLSFNKTLLKRCCSQVAEAKPWTSSLESPDAWASKTADVLRENCSFIRHAIAKDPQPLWTKALTSKAAPVETFIDEHLSPASKQAKTEAGPGTPQASDQYHPGAGSSAQADQVDLLTPSPRGGNKGPSRPADHLAKDKSTCRSPSKSGNKQDCSKTVPSVDSQPPEYLFGWSHEHQKAWRLALATSGKMGVKEYCLHLGYKRPFSAEDTASYIWGCWTDSDDQDFEITDMPISVYCSRYDYSWIRRIEAEIEKNGLKNAVDLPGGGGMAMPMAGYKQAAPSTPAAAPSAPAAGKSAPEAAPSAPAAAPVQPLKPTAKSSLRKPQEDQSILKDGSILQLVYKKQNGRNDIYQVLLNSRQLVQAPGTSEGQTALRTVISKISTGEVPKMPDEAKPYIKICFPPSRGFLSFHKSFASASIFVGGEAEQDSREKHEGLVAGQGCIGIQLFCAERGCCSGWREDGREGEEEREQEDSCRQQKTCF